jgi:hypothetical protein
MKSSIPVILVSLLSICWALEEASPPSQGSSPLIETSTPARTKDYNAALKETLINLEKQSWEAWKKRDGKFFQEFLSDDHVEVGSSGAATKAQVVAFVASPVCVINSYSIDKFELKMLDSNIALLTYHAVQDTTCSGVAVPSPVWASSLYVKQGDRWRNAFYQQTQTRK